ncbi:MAG: hypothetical protein LBI12_02005 [Treponema sp.]|jgi:hypothetical protein|nr:hypothetical protein [Treponema sp.]
MSDQENPKGLGFVKHYLNFIDKNVLFKKPISCLYAIVSLLIPVYFLIQIIQFGIFDSGSAPLIVAAVLFLLVLICAGFFGSLIWWFRRISRDEGPGWYVNFRRFIQTLGEWTATVFAIVVFFGVLIIMIIAREEYWMIMSMLPLPIPALEVTIALSGPVIGFLIIVVTKIILFLLDPFIWLIKQIWSLIVRVVQYFYRCILKTFSVFEKDAPVWIGVNWLIAVLVVTVGLVIGIKFISFQNMAMCLGAALVIALGLVYMGFLVIKRKSFEGK